MIGLHKKAATLSLVAVTVAGCSQERFVYTGGASTGLALGARMSETFYQNKSQGQVDILVVDDNSSSMGPEQAKLSQRFNTFGDALKSIDYQIGIVTTDLDSATMSKGILLPIPGLQTNIIKASDANPAQIFKTAVAIGTTGSGNEQPLGASIMAFDKRNAENAGFFRDNTDVAILVISDEDEMSDGKQGTTASQVIDHFKGIWGDTKRLIAFGIVVQPGDTACLTEQRAQLGGTDSFYGTHVTDLANQTGGATFNICDSDYSSSLAAIGQKVRNLLFSVQLSAAPVADSVSIDISTGEKIPFHVDGNNIVFDHPPQQGARIVVSYNKQATN